jgi:regulator of sigma E protease
LNIAVSILGLALLVLIHEAGHFVVALAVRMRPRRFYIGFPPAVVKRVRNGVEYGIGAIPLGGYVKIPGMHRPAAGDVESNVGRALDEAPWLAREIEPVKRALAQGQLDEARHALPELRAALARADLSPPAGRAAERGLTDLDDALAPDAYWRADAWKRIAVIVAGPATNLVFAIGLLAVVFMLGVPVDTTRRVESVIAGSPAERAGLEPRDEIVAINGAPTEPTEISNTIRESRGAELTVTVERNGRRRELRPARATRIEGNFRLGFLLAPRYESYGPARSFRLAAEETWLVTKAIGASLGRIVTGSGREDLATPVGIVQGSSQTLEQEGFRVYLRILAFISLSLALLNLLPLLPLDGGHIAFSLIEKLRGRALPREAYERVSVFGIALVLLLFVLGLSNDIDRLNGG